MSCCDLPATKTHIDKLLHAKCPVIQTVSRQIKKIKVSGAGRVESAAKDGGWITKENKIYWLVGLAILAVLAGLGLMWLLLIYGAMLGASLCGPTSCSGCFGSCSSVSGLNLVRSSIF